MALTGRGRRCAELSRNRQAPRAQSATPKPTTTSPIGRGIRNLAGSFAVFWVRIDSHDSRPRCGLILLRQRRLFGSTNESIVTLHRKRRLTVV